jgi:hypothetical protein
MTKNELITQCKKENPKMFSTINDEQIEITGADYEAACESWAQMRLEQLQAEQEILDKKTNRTALLVRLGISEDEASLLLS